MLHFEKPCYWKAQQQWLKQCLYPCSYGSAPQDLKYDGEPTTLAIGSNNQFRECVSVHRGTVQGGGKTIVGITTSSGHVHVAHDCVLEHVLANYTGLSGHVVMEDFITLGGQNGVTQFVTLVPTLTLVRGL